MVLRRTGLDDLPLLMVLGLSAGLLVWAGLGADRGPSASASSREARAQHELSGAPAIDRLAGGSERAQALVNDVRGALLRLAPTAVPAELETAPPEPAAQERGLDGLRRSGLIGSALSAEDLRMEGELVDGVPRGRWTVTDVRGRRLFSGAFGPNGEPVGVWTWNYADGTPLAEGAFTDGQPDGLWNEWHPNGQLASATNFELGQLDGSALEWFETGVAKQQGGFGGDERVGLWTSFYENGKMRARGAYDRGLRTGLWEEWHPNGRPMLTATYDRGRAEGEWHSWYSNGQTKERGLFVQGRREGLWRFFMFDGSIDLRSGYYVAGQLVHD